jgi:hypothetical protein
MKDDFSRAEIPTAGIGGGYIFTQITRALATASQHGDADTRQRALQKIGKWTQVLSGMADGSIQVGGRMPLAGVPVWVTPEVATGGFVTGSLLAAGPLLEHERAWLAELPGGAQAGSCADASPSAGRLRLNLFFLSDEGIDRLWDMLRNGNYEIALPEEGTLLVITWLLRHGHADAARAVLDEIEPFLDRLRFYPIPAREARTSGIRVFLETAGQARNKLEHLVPPRQLLAQREAVGVWTPLYDEVVALFLETVSGEPPVLKKDHAGNRTVAGGWPCQCVPEGWNERARALLERYEQAKTLHKSCGKHATEKHGLGCLIGMLGKIQRAGNHSPLTGREVGRARLILARTIAARGMPESAQRQRERARQHAHVNAPFFCAIARVVTHRMTALPEADGVDDVDALLGPATGAEADRLGLPEGTKIPAPVARKARRCQADNVEALVARGLITSGDVLAVVMPRITSGLRGAGIADTELRRLYSAIYCAFRKRRSLLLLNLESQVRVEELPWVSAIDRFREDSPAVQEVARQTLEETAVLAMTAFPHAIIPNKLLRELNAQAAVAKCPLPLVEEVAADIFMGRFSKKFSAAALLAAGLLSGTMYERYYGINYGGLKKLADAQGQNPATSWLSRVTSLLKEGPSPKQPDSVWFEKLCEERAGVRGGGWGAGPAKNGMIIEQQQILTTQNLAVLFTAMSPPAAGVFAQNAGELARRCFSWVCRRQQVKIADAGWHARLVMLKNTAYAWRQMLFFLSLLSESGCGEFASWSSEHFAAQPDSFRARFAPVMEGLRLVLAGRTLDVNTREETGARPFLGWSDNRHWLL